MSSAAGGFVWYQLATQDVAAARLFYARVLGWEFADACRLGPNYAMAMLGTQRVAGLSGYNPHGATGWTGYIHVDDADEAAARIEAAGGSVRHGPIDIPHVGRIASVSDLQGASFMLLQSPVVPDPPAAAPGMIGWRELHTSQWESAFGFYETLFGWRRSHTHYIAATCVYQTFSIGDRWAGGMTSAQCAAPHWVYHFTVDDIDAAVTRIADSGGVVTAGPRAVPGRGWVVEAADPQGVSFALRGPRARPQLAPHPPLVIDLHAGGDSPSMAEPPRRTIGESQARRHG